MRYTSEKLALAASIISSVAAIPSVTTSNDALALAKKVLGPGLTVVDASYQGGASQSGFFTGGPLGIPDSIVLTTGDATHPTDSTGVGTDVSQPGFDKCVTLSGSGNAYDAAVLTIKAKVENGYLGVFANFVFATDEYPKYVGSKFNDVFGIWVDGQQIAYDANGAPITINGGFFSTDNVLQPPNSGTTYLGSTPLLTSGFATTPGEHTIEIAVCDISDYIRDSAVFLTLAGCSDASSCKNGTSKVTTTLTSVEPTPLPTGGAGSSTSQGPYGNGTIPTYVTPIVNPTAPANPTTYYGNPTATGSLPTQFTGAAAPIGNSAGYLAGFGAFVAGLVAIF